MDAKCLAHPGPAASKSQALGGNLPDTTRPCARIQLRIPSCIPIIKQTYRRKQVISEQHFVGRTHKVASVLCMICFTLLAIGKDKGRGSNDSVC